MTRRICEECDKSFGADRFKKCRDKKGRPCGELANQGKEPEPKQIELEEWLRERDGDGGDK